MSENTSSPEPLIRMQAITKIFKSGAGEFKALDDINLDFYRGEFIGIVGKSGSGKSTLANMITGIDHPTSGNILIDGKIINQMNESDMSVWRGHNLGIVFQFYQLLPMLTLLENVLLPMDFCNFQEPTMREARARELLAMVGLGDLADKLPAMTSGGQQQTAAIARALANDPPILIADEPTGNLDSRTAESVFELFTHLVDQGKTIIMVTHDPSLARRTSRSIKIHDGRVVTE
jgi:putative ABC transport system ATP-binding protein